MKGIFGEIERLVRELSPTVMVPPARFQRATFRLVRITRRNAADLRREQSEHT
jgi:hypothetical protein